jgi:hypothetical protein
MRWFQRQSSATALLAIWLISTASGCGKKQSTSLEVHGKVTLSGSPVEDAVVTFYPTSQAGQTPTARSDPEGNFSLRADPGEYKVVVVKSDSKAQGPRAMLRLSKSTLPSVYASPATTPLQCTVPPPDTLSFDLIASKKTR